jgi:hypothetical protein
MGIHAFVTKSIEVTKSTNEELLLVYTSETWCIPKYGWDVDYSYADQLFVLFTHIQQSLSIVARIEAFQVKLTMG